MKDISANNDGYLYFLMNIDYLDIQATLRTIIGTLIKVQNEQA